ncbi:MAG: acylphosphatase [Acidobacteria bacterium]|nr:acylphosphatase [Acidobacteriota bacterium]
MAEYTNLARRYVVRGRVQGVGFRYFVQQAGTRLKVGGWVKNRADGSVEAHAEGPPEALAAFREALGKGPPLSRVDAIHESPTTTGGDGVFRIVS